VSAKNISEDFMKKQGRTLWFVGALALFLSVGMALSAQNTQPAQTPNSQAQQPPTPDQTTPQATPEQSQQPAAPTQGEPSPSTSQTADQSGQSATGVQVFTGTVVKSGDKYVFQDAASGNTYDIDHQDEVQKFEGKKVKVHGTLDASAKMIHLQ
jgi:uncharacterized protein YdeI (BOF family)